MRENGETFGTVGGGSLEAMVEKICRETFLTKKNQIMQFRLHEKDHLNLDMRCGGDAEVSFEYIDSEGAQSSLFDLHDKAVAYIFGGGHVGKAIEPLLRYVNFSAVILDDREEYASSERFPEADRLVVLKDFDHAFEDIETDENSYVIIVTRGHKGDYQVLKNALKQKSAYIGMIGSRTKVAEVMNKLRQEGFAQEDLDRVYSPIGLSIFAETPEEIGISVVAEMIMVRAGHGK